jgi:hypothetical protein
VVLIRRGRVTVMRLDASIAVPLSMLTEMYSQKISGAGVIFCLRSDPTTLIGLKP